LSSLADRILELKRCAEAIAAELVNIATRRKARSLDAVIGDKTAQSAIHDLDQETDALKKEAMTISSALEMAEQREREEQQEVEAKLRREREVEAYNHARGVVALNHELDQALIALRQLFERRAVVLKGLGDTGVVDLNLIMRLNHRSGASASAILAGLNRFLNLEHINTSALHPLASSDEVLLRIGVNPEKETRVPFTKRKVPLQ
jgi:hypothetical protein